MSAFAADKAMDRPDLQGVVERILSVAGRAQDGQERSEYTRAFDAPSSRRTGRSPLWTRKYCSARSTEHHTRGSWQTIQEA
jgi:hypothetical protein